MVVVVVVVVVVVAVVVMMMMMISRAPIYLGSKRFIVALGQQRRQQCT